MHREASASRRFSFSCAVYNNYTGAASGRASERAPTYGARLIRRIIQEITGNKTTLGHLKAKYNLRLAYVHQRAKPSYDRLRAEITRVCVDTLLSPGEHRVFQKC